MRHQKVTSEFPTAAEIGSAIKGAIADAHNAGKAIRGVRLDAEGAISFIYDEPTVTVASQTVGPERPRPVDNLHWITASYVYVIGEVDRGPVKIGVSAEPKLRLRDHQTSYPYKLEVLAQCNGGKETEAKLHALFKKERLLGEWFKRSARIRTFIDMISCGVGLSLAIKRVSRAPP